MFIKGKVIQETAISASIFLKRRWIGANRNSLNVEDIFSGQSEVIIAFPVATKVKARAIEAERV